MSIEKFWDVLPIILLAMSQLATIAIIMNLNRRTKKLERLLCERWRHEVEDEYTDELGE